jgi:signal transduction histidine kinase
LHEQVAQKIAAIKLYMEMSDRPGSFRVGYLEQGKQLLSELLNDVRKLSNSIFPSNLASIPMKNLLNDFVVQARKIYSFRIEMLSSDNVSELNFENSITCLRIVEKWLAELSQRKNVNQVKISFNLDEKIYMKITDDSSRLASKEMEECIVKSMVYSRAKIAGGVASYVSDDNYYNVLSVVI